MKLKQHIHKTLLKIAYFLSGDKMIDWGWDKSVGFIVTVFFLITTIIGWNLMVENRLVITQENERVLNDLEIQYQQLSIDYVSLDKRTRIEKMLEEDGSSLKSPVEPPCQIEL